MGKVVGLIGAASGKVGNIVYAVTNGIQTARVYQPIVSNPKSALQNAQRAKGNLAGRISAFVPRTALMGLGANARIRRGEFLRAILRAATVVQAGGVYTAKVDDDAVIFSKGNIISSVRGPVFAAGQNTLDVTLSGVSESALPAEVYASRQTRLVAMVYDRMTGDLVEVATKIANKPAQGGTAVTEININHTLAYDVVVYAIPMSTADGSAVSISTENATLSDSEIAAILSVNRNAVVFEYGMSYVIGQAAYVPVP